MIRSTLFLLFICSTALSTIKGQCVTIRVRQAAQPSLNGLYELLEERCDGHDVWEHSDHHTYIVYGTKSGDPGWAIVDEFCSLDAQEMAVVSGRYGYPYDTLTYGNWYERLPGNSTSTTSASLLLTCANRLDDNDVVVYDVHHEVYYEDSSLSGAAIFGIVFGCLVVCVLITVCVLLIVRRRRVIVARQAHIYHRTPVGTVAVSSGPSTTFLVGSAPVANCAVIGSPVYYQPCANRVVLQQQTRIVSSQSRPPSYSTSNQSRPPSYSKVRTR